MKKILFCTLALLLFVVANAQNNSSFDKANLHTAELTAEYNLTASQQKEVRKVMLIKLQNLEQIAPLKATDPTAFLAKKRALRTYVEGKLEQILSGPQLSILQRKQEDRLLAERQIRKNMKGAPPEAIREALLKMEQ